jgi:hypothetical protein
VEGHQLFEFLFLQVFPVGQGSYPLTSVTVQPQSIFSSQYFHGGAFAHLKSGLPACQAGDEFESLIADDDA